jgi:hypothetical protein
MVMVAVVSIWIIVGKLWSKRWVWGWSHPEPLISPLLGVLLRERLECLGIPCRATMSRSIRGDSNYSLPSFLPLISVGWIEWVFPSNCRWLNGSSLFGWQYISGQDSPFNIVIVTMKVSMPFLNILSNHHLCIVCLFRPSFPPSLLPLFIPHLCNRLTSECRWRGLTAINIRAAISSKPSIGGWEATWWCWW